MWSPTHIQVTVQRAKGLLTKGKNGTNNCFVTIALGKEKYQTSVKDKAEPSVAWNEECELKIPDQGNRAELMLTCMHRNNLGLDEFLGQVTLPLNEMDVYDRPRSRWLRLESKPGQEKKNKERGELEVRISFTVKSGSLADLSKKEKHKSSIGQLASSVGGSLLSIGTIEKRKGIKKFAKSLGSKMHLHTKKKNKDGDDLSVSGSFASIGTPNSGASNGGSRRFGQRAGEADPGVISEDEDEFVFDNLSHKSSGSSLNIRSGLGASTGPHSYAPSPLSTKIGAGGKKSMRREPEEDLAIDPELEAIENDLRARTLPPPSKPPRTPQLGSELPALDKAKDSNKDREQKLDEWEKKLYGKHLEVGSSDSLKRRSWEMSRVPLPTANEETGEQLQADASETVEQIKEHFDSSSTSSSSDEEQEPAPDQKREDENEAAARAPELSAFSEASIKVEPSRAQEPNVAPTTPADSPKPAPPLNLLSPDVERNDFNKFNASFAQFEQRNSDKIFENDAAKKWSTNAFIKLESESESVSSESAMPRKPQAMPRNRETSPDLRQLAAAEERRLQAEREEEQRQKQRAEEDARLEAELRLNEQRLREEEEALQAELRQQEEQRRREAKRREEDQRILNFMKRSTSTEEDEEQRSTQTPEQSPRERVGDKREKRLGKFKYFHAKRDKHDEVSSSSPSPKSSERIIIGHEKSASHAERRAEISAALAKKYEGKSREELMLIANGMENEALLQRQRVKELEDYLDNLLLRVMETHPKILQNPYSRTTSAKSFKNYINMNDFL